MLPSSGESSLQTANISRLYEEILVAEQLIDAVRGQMLRATEAEHGNAGPFATEGRTARGQKEQGIRVLDAMEDTGAQFSQREMLGRTRVGIVKLEARLDQIALAWKGRVVGVIDDVAKAGNPWRPLTLVRRPGMPILRVREKWSAW